MGKKLNKILYVEDDPTVATVTEMTLTKIGGFKIKHCSSGQKAIDCIVEFNPDLILMDMMMPDMDGLKTIENIKRIDKAKDIPFIFMTAKAQVHEQEQYKKAGALGIIMKPYEINSLCLQIKKLWEIYNG